MGDWFSPIAQALSGNVKQELAMNPAYSGGAALLNEQAPVIGNNFWSAFLPQVALGAGSGLAMGYGRSQVEDKQKNIADAIASVYAEEDPTKRASLIASSPYLKELAPQLQAAETQHQMDLADRNSQLAIQNPDKYYQAIALGLIPDPTKSQTNIPGNKPEGPLTQEDQARADALQAHQDAAKKDAIDLITKYHGSEALRNQQEMSQFNNTLNSPEKQFAMTERMRQHWDANQGKVADQLLPLKKLIDDYSSLNSPIADTAMLETVQRGIMAGGNQTAIREGLFNLLRDSQNPLYKAKGEVLRWMGGGSLSPETRAQIVPLIKTLVDGKLGEVATDAQSIYNKAARHFGADLPGEDVITKYDLLKPYMPSEQAQQAPLDAATYSKLRNQGMSKEQIRAMYGG